MIEVELKFEIAPHGWKQLQDKLDAMPGMHRSGQSEGLDSYYDTSSFDCLQQAVFLRIRNHTSLQIKFHEDADPAHIHSTERAFPLHSDSLAMKEMNTLCACFVPEWREACTVKDAFQTNGFLEFARIKKLRTQYLYSDMIICIDRVEGLGDFLEIETQCEEGMETEEVVISLQRFVADLAFPALQPVSIGYVELWLRKYLPQTYRLGKYQAENHPAWNVAH